MLPPFNAVQAFNDLDHVLRIEELYLLQRVAQKITSILDLETLLDQIVADVAATFGYNRLAILLKDDRTGELVVAAGWTGQHVAEPPRSKVDIPLQIRGELIGSFNFEHMETNAFSPERIRLLEALAGHVATAIANARMFERERVEKERMTKELEEACAIQSGLFPVKAPEAAGFELNGVCTPCREVGGDWFDYIRLGDGRLAVVLADVSGKGMGAALLMSSTRSALRLHSARGLSPREILFELNKFLVQDFPASKFVTLVYVVLDPAGRTMTFASAGHLPPLYVDMSGAQFLKADSGLPLGIMECEFSEHEIAMPAGSRVFLYSDGVTEAINSAQEEYGPERMLKHVSERPATVQSLLDDVAKFTCGYPASDDVTVVMIGAAT
ncbi:MAG TPA: GAF domain-containing SpoIIE family protein phosphatase [Pyrinomonadaceae bacterium]